jgi:Recombination endonuclease VII
MLLKPERRPLRANLKRYGLTEDDYDTMYHRQNGRCAICGKLPFNKLLVVDHDHETGQVRDLLCGGCNSGLGMFRDDPETLEAAASYLARHHGRLRLLSSVS